MILSATFSPGDNRRPPLKRSRSTDEELDGAIPRKQPHLDIEEVQWLYDFHKYLWNQPQLEQEIFRTADLTLAHWIKLQEDLNAELPTRHSDAYVAVQDVSAIKLRILHSSPPDLLDGSLPATTAGAVITGEIGVQSREDDFDDSDETLDGTNLELWDIERFFPTRIKYLDLSAIPYLSRPDRCPCPLLIRDEYETMEKILNAGLKGRQGSVFLTGQPGIGMRFGSHVNLLTT